MGKQDKKKDEEKLSKASNAKKLIQRIWAVITNKQDTQGEFTKRTLILLMTYLLNVFSVLLFLFFAVGICTAIYGGCTSSWNSIGLWFNNIVVIIFEVALSVIAFLLAIMLKGFANEVEREKDRDYIVAIFSGVVSFAALIISLIALIRG